MNNDLVLKPRMSEKAYGLSQTRNTYVFDVPADANKHTVARAVTTQFKVEVTKVNIANLDGKSKRTVRKSGRSAKGRQNDISKAYVTLKAGDTLPIFAALEQEADPTEATAKKKPAKEEKK